MIKWPRARKMCEQSYLLFDLVEWRIGRYVAVAPSDTHVAQFQAAVIVLLREVLTDPLRLLTAKHAANAIAYRWEGLHPATKPLLEGVIAESVWKGEVERMLTTSDGSAEYAVIYYGEARQSLHQTLELLIRNLTKQGNLLLQDIERLIPEEWQVYPPNARVMMGALVASGHATLRSDGLAGIVAT